MGLMQDKVVVVTGAGTGIGAGTSAVLAGQGAVVVMAGLDDPALAASAAEVPGASAVPADVTDPDSVDRLFQHCVREHGRVDAVVHAAGIDDPATKDLVARQVAEGTSVDTVADLTDGQWNRMIEVNLTGSFIVLRAALRTMRTQGYGSVVLIGSETGVRGLSGLAHYASSKGGVHALVRSASQEAISYGVRVNGIAPGVIDTPMSRRSSGLFGGAGRSIAPIGRVGRPEEIGGVAAFLCSDLASYVVGEIINVDGGRMAC